MVRKVSGILADTTELRKLILEHPDYPIAVVCSEEANSGDYSWMYASDITFSLGELLDCEQSIDDCRVFCDRDDFEEQLEEQLWDEMCDELGDDVEPTEEEFQKRFAEEKAQYEPYWRNCIVIWADN